MQKLNLPSASMPYSQNLLNQLCDDNEGILASKQPSSLLEVPRVNEKYEINSFRAGDNLKTKEMLRNFELGQPILNYNCGFFGGTSLQSQSNVVLKDSFGDLLKEQHKWQNQNKIGSVATGIDLVNYSELYHPFSLHN